MQKLKDLYTKEYIEKLAFDIGKLYQPFDQRSFKDTIFDPLWKSLELKQRMRHIATTLHIFLPLPYPKQLEILKTISQNYRSLESMFFQDFVGVYGLKNFEESMNALAVFTIDSSSEFAIREFILRYEEQTMEQMKLWAKNPNEHIRRLSSEGCRPRLPWAIALPSFKKDPSKVFEIIELLKNDSSKYVQKSVANNLNDISKDHPKLVIEFVRANLGISKSLDFICKHGSRTLLKKGEIEVLKLFGFETVDCIINNFIVDESISIGDNLFFSFELKTDTKIEKIRIEYMIEYLKSNGKYSKKIFMLHQNKLERGIKIFAKKQSFQDMTTRKHYVGKHFISIVVNGEIKITKEFFVI